MALRFSILTPTLDRRAMLSEAIASVAAQDWPDVEHVVADGGSSDGTLEMVSGAANVRLIEGPDRGIYDGLNKALAAARGDVVGWLNSDDLYAPGAFVAAAAAFAANPDAAAVCGGAQIEADGVVERVYAPQLVADLSPGALLIGPTLPNAWFFRPTVMSKVGPFDTNFRYAADGDFMVRFANLDLPVAIAPQLFYRYRRHTGSATLRDNNVSEAVRIDMLRLAEKWRDDRDQPVRVAARALEGRCRAMLASAAFGRRDFGVAASHLLHAPAVVSGVTDYMKRRIAPRLRRRRIGSPPG